MNKNELIALPSIQKQIYTISGLQVMFDSNLAELYQVEIRALNQAVKRNIERFPENFRFQLSHEEYQEFLRSQNVILEKGKGKHRKYLPYVFTEQGVAMLSAVLKSNIAVKVSVQIIQAFVEMRKFIANNATIFHRLDQVEQKQLITDTKLNKVFEAIEAKEITPRQGIFFDGQVFDAYKFVSNLIRKAKNSIILIDNYIDESVLTHFGKRKKNVSLTILTKNISKKLRLDIQKFNEQYPAIAIKEFKQAHDRFFRIEISIYYGCY